MNIITITNNVTANHTTMTLPYAINLDHLAKAFDMGEETKTIEGDGVIAVFYTNGHATWETCK